MPGGDLHVAEADTVVEHGGDEGVPQHMRVHPRHPHASSGGVVFEPTSRDAPVHPPAQDVAQDRPGGTAMRCGRRSAVVACRDLRTGAVAAEWMVASPGWAAPHASWLATRARALDLVQASSASDANEVEIVVLRHQVAVPHR